MTLRVAYLGNFEPYASTENDLLDAFTHLGVDADPLQEQDEAAWKRLGGEIGSMEPPDAIFWTRTKSLSEQIHPSVRWSMLISAGLAGIPTIGVHLDRWWGLRREPDLYNDPFFRVQYLFTADGHDPKRWTSIGANHHWMPPAIAPRWCFDGTSDPRFESEIAFVGSWQDYGHTEWTHRREIVRFLQQNYPGRFRLWPEPGQPAIRGTDLNDLYASTKVVLGDSCLVPDPVTGKPWTHYCSDRVFETIGRGALLVHPFVDGVVGSTWDDLLVVGHDVVGWPLGDWVYLKESLEYALCSDQAATIRESGTTLVRESHTYADRLRNIFATVGLTL